MTVREQSSTGVYDAPRYGSVYWDLLTEDDGPVRYSIRAVGANNLVYLLSSQHRPSQSDWQRMLVFIGAHTSTSNEPLVSGPLDDDEHPIPDSAIRVRDLHEDSGLTWEQLARAFGVSRRSVHAWASGGRINARNLEWLAHIESVVEAHTQASPADTRTALMSRTEGQKSAFQSLLSEIDQRVVRVKATPAQMLQIPDVTIDATSPVPRDDS